MEYWKKEILAFVISVFYLTLIFSFEVGKGILPERIPLAFLVSLILFGTKIGLQKILCSKLNLKGSLKVWNSGIFSGILLMIFGIKFALPSILEIKPFKFGRWGFKVSHLSYKEAGLISLVGILVPLLSLFLFKHVFNNFFLATISAWFYFSNILPIPKSDGGNILFWNFALWGALVLVGALLIVF